MHVRCPSCPGQASQPPGPCGGNCPLPPPSGRAGLLCSGHFLSPADPAAWPARRRSYPPLLPSRLSAQVTGRARPGLQGCAYDSAFPGACGFQWPLESGLEWRTSVPAPASLGCQSLPLPPSLLVPMWKQPRRYFPGLRSHHEAGAELGFEPGSGGLF